MFFEHRALSLPKDLRRPEEYQDAFAVDAARGAAAIADGVSSSLFAARWAKLLADQAAAQPPAAQCAAELEAWLGPLRQKWSAEIDTAALAWPQKAKVRDGASATLLWLDFAPLPPGGGAEGLRYTCRSVGDCCLFHLRSHRVLRSFPMQSSGDFTTHPRSLCSVRRKEDGLLIGAHQARCLRGDMLALCTDALAEWILARLEGGFPPPILEWWEMRPEQFSDWLGPLREAKTIRPDDTTLVLLKVIAGKG